jgi:hypothetical protein
VFEMAIREGDFEVQLALEIAGLCETYGVLPRAGGLLDQDSYHVYMMRAVQSAKQKRQEREQTEREVKGHGNGHAGNAPRPPRAR